MSQRKNLVRLYRLYRIPDGVQPAAYGEPFALCDKHARSYVPDPRAAPLVVEKLADRSLVPCTFCDLPCLCERINV